MKIQGLRALVPVACAVFVAACSDPGRSAGDRTESTRGAIDETPSMRWDGTFDTPFTTAALGAIGVDAANDIVVSTTGYVPARGAYGTVVTKIDPGGKLGWSFRDDEHAWRAMAVSDSGNVALGGDGAILRLDAAGHVVGRTAATDGTSFVDVAMCNDGAAFAIGAAPGGATRIARIGRSPDVVVPSASPAGVRCDGRGGAFVALTYANGPRAGVVHVDATSAVAWSFIAPDSSEADAIAIDQAGNLLLGGVAETPRVEYTQRQLRATKLDSTGNPVWTRTFAGTRDTLAGIVSAQDGRVMLAGTAGGNSASATFRTVALDADGATLWAVDDDWGGMMVSTASRLDLTPKGASCVVGGYRVNTQANYTPSLVVYDRSDGSVAWRLASDAPFAFGLALPSSDGGITIAGTAGGQLRVARYGTR